MAEIGPRLTEILRQINASPRTVQSDFARANAAYIGAAASLGYISTRLPDGSFSRKWRVTEAGLRYLRVFG